ncbi:MAG TPA: choice-of-anchor D domain-containing protein, partial [Terriglobales bacterium]
MTQRRHLLLVRGFLSFIALAIFMLAALPAHAQNGTLNTVLATFSDTAVGSTSAAKPVTLSNTGSATLVISSISTSGDFAQSNNCPRSLARSAKCTINVTFKPSGLGLRWGLLTVRGNAGTDLALLAGTGIPQVTVSPTSLSFASQALGTSSPAKTATIKNNQTVVLNIPSIAMSGDFAQTNNCGGQLAAGASCTLNITFKPTATGARTGNASISVNAGPTPQKISLTGTGTSPTLQSIAITPVN